MLKTLFGIKEEDYHSPELYHKNLYDQYKLFIEMTDRMHQRRQQILNWYITLNVGFLTLLGFLLDKDISTILVMGLATIGVLNCLIWKRLLKSYEQIKTGRFKVIHEIEEKLPLQLYKAEWDALKEGNDNKTYKPVTQLEQTIPLIFMAVYIIVGICSLVI